jgi:hypothetical protein
LLGCAAALLCWLPAELARAYEDQLTLGVGAGYAHAFASAGPEHGALVDVAASTGLSSTWTLRGRLSYAFYPAERSPAHAGLVGAELLYMIDIVELVPYLGAGIDGVGRARAGDFRVDGAAHLVLGIDYLVSRGFALGLDVRSHLLVTAWRRDPVDLMLALSATWIIDR